MGDPAPFLGPSEPEYEFEGGDAHLFETGKSIKKLAEFIDQTPENFSSVIDQKDYLDRLADETERVCVKLDAVELDALESQGRAYVLDNVKQAIEEVHSIASEKGPIARRHFTEVIEGMGALVMAAELFWDALKMAHGAKLSGMSEMINERGEMGLSDPRFSAGSLARNLLNGHNTLIRVLESGDQKKYRSDILLALDRIESAMQAMANSGIAIEDSLSSLHDFCALIWDALDITRAELSKYKEDSEADITVYAERYLGEAITFLHIVHRITDRYSV